MVNKKIIITDRLLSNWMRCKRKAWLDLFQEKSQRRWSSHRSLLLDNQYQSLIAFCKAKPGLGIDACKKGYENVMTLRLQGETSNDQLIEARPTLVQKIEGQSCWGDFKYRPIIVKQGKNLTQNHRLILTLWSVLLQDLQNAPVNECLAISLKSEKLEIQKLIISSKNKAQLEESIRKVSKTITKDSIPPLTYDRKKCSICSWKKFCDQEALAKGELSEVSGIGAKRKEVLELVGIKNINNLARINPKSLNTRLRSLKKNHGIIAKDLIMQAKSQTSLEPLKLTKSSPLRRLNNLPGVLIYDIESDPDENHNFLHGILIVKRSLDGLLNIKDSEYKSQVYLDKFDQFSCWNYLKKEFQHYPDWPILHYGETEALTILKMTEKLGEGKEARDIIEERFIDIHQIVRENWILPLRNYSLKTVSKWVGFEWEDANADGSKALLWWRQYKGSIKRKKVKEELLQKILDYNKDDCLATLKITNWMLSN